MLYPSMRILKGQIGQTVFFLHTPHLLCIWVLSCNWRMTHSGSGTSQTHHLLLAPLTLRAAGGDSGRSQEVFRRERRAKFMLEYMQAGQLILCRRVSWWNLKIWTFCDEDPATILAIPVAVIARWFNLPISPRSKFSPSHASPPASPTARPKGRLNRSQEPGFPIVR